MAVIDGFAAAAAGVRRAADMLAGLAAGKRKAATADLYGDKFARNAARAKSSTDWGASDYSAPDTSPARGPWWDAQP